VTGDGAFVRVWRYRVADHARAAFERAYGSDGDWARLFARGEGYLGTQLLRDAHDGAAWMTLDRWRDAAAWQAFRARFAAEYDALDRACATLTEDERDLGDYLES
jgi:heme-degrading monooxygenase HmoA